MMMAAIEYPLARIAGEGGERSETGEGAARSDADCIRALTLPLLRNGSLPLPQCGRGVEFHA
jgi:hypothetical protein